jgi:hypothetical protein
MNQIIGTIIGFVMVVLALSALLSLPVMWLWDWLMPELFGLKTITWAQAWGLNFLCGLLFKSHTTASK